MPLIAANAIMVHAAGTPISCRRAGGVDAPAFHLRRSSKRIEGVQRRSIVAVSSPTHHCRRSLVRPRPPNQAANLQQQPARDLRAHGSSSTLIDGSPSPSGGKGGASSSSNQSRLLLLLLSLVRSTAAMAVDLFARLLPGFQAVIWLANIMPANAKKSYLQMLYSFKEEVTLRGITEDEAERLTTHVMKSLLRGMCAQIISPVPIGSSHEALRAPFDYYQMGMDVFGPLIDVKRSIITHPERWTEIQEQLAAGENVVLYANHQSESDALMIPLLLDASHPGLGEQVIYVAGDRVITDKFARPFSIGRNLFTVYSKKHINDDPATRSTKIKHNIHTLKEMEHQLHEGGKCIWIAPSGGRDRRQPDGSLEPDSFESAVVEMMHKLGTKPKLPSTHYYPLAMATYQILPPPSCVEKAVGESRKVNFTGVGLALGEEVDVSPSGPWIEGVANLDDKDELADALTSYIHAKVRHEYRKVAACNEPNEPGTKRPVPLPENSVRPGPYPLLPKM